MPLSSREVFNWVSRAFEDPAPDLNWETKTNKRSSQWTAHTSEGDRYAITSRGIGLGRLVNVTFEESGTPRSARGKRIASTDTFELGAVCASFHYYRLTNSREVDRRESTGKES